MAKVKKHRFWDNLSFLVLVGVILMFDLVLIGQVITNIRILNLEKVPEFVRAKFSSPLPSATPIPTWSLLITGDVIPARNVNAQMLKRQDFFWPVREIMSVLQDADLTLINLEAPLLKNCPVMTEGFQFCADARFASILKESGVDVVNLANNHTLNFGWEGLGETEELLNMQGIETTGFHSLQSAVDSEQLDDFAENIIPSTNLGIWDPQNKILKQVQDDRIECNNDIYCSKLAIKVIKDIKIGFLGYNGVGQQIDRKISEQEIKKAREMVDVLVVSVHWGKEYEREPLPDASLAPDDPREIGRLFIDWGADAVVGNHPHWYQPVEWIDEKPIFYALGNTVFDQEWSLETKRGILAKLHFKGKQIIKDKTEITPLGIRNFGEAYLLEGDEKEEVTNFYQ